MAEIYATLRDGSEHYIPRGRRWQRLWRAMHQISLVGMNYGFGARTDDTDTVAVGLLRGPEPVIFDGGAHGGAYSENALRERPDARIFAFEPSPTAFPRVERTLAGRAQVFQLGLYDTTSELPMFAEEEVSMGASLLPQDRPYWHADFSERWTVDVTTIDEFCAEHEIDRIDLLKLDIEGAELAALRGASRMLEEGRVGMIQFEWGLPALPARVHLLDFFNLLKGWRIHRIVRGGIVPIDWHERWEIAWTTNYLAISPQMQADLAVGRPTAR
ncbi:MAG: FkbM family methyltransferase [Solirubrobacteraceae bacterium]